MENNLREISEDLIDLCENIKIIEEPFDLEKAGEQYKIRDLESEF